VSKIGKILRKMGQKKKELLERKIGGKSAHPYFTLPMTYMGQHYQQMKKGNHYLHIRNF